MCTAFQLAQKAKSGRSRFYLTCMELVHRSTSAQQPSHHIFCRLLSYRTHMIAFYHLKSQKNGPHQRLPHEDLLLPPLATACFALLTALKELEFLQGCTTCT